MFYNVEQSIPHNLLLIYYNSFKPQTFIICINIIIIINYIKDYDFHLFF